MRTRFMTIIYFALTAFFAVTGLSNAEERLKFEQIPLTATDISSVTGLNIYKYRIAMKPGTKFEIVVSVIDAPDAKPQILNQNVFTSNVDGNAVDMLLSFLPRDNSLRGVLLSQDEEIGYRIDCSGCSPTGIATNISLPLRDIRGSRKTLIPLTADSSAKLSGLNEICLITILATNDGEPASMQKSYPRAKVSVVFAD